VTLEELENFLTQRGVTYTEEPMQHGTKVICATGEVFCHYPKRGKVAVQGRASALGQAVEQWVASGFTPAPAQDGTVQVPVAGGPDRRIFIVYGHDTDARNSLELLLHRMGLTPVVLANLPAAGDTIIEKLEKYLGESSNVGFACVILTPDDEGHAKGREEEKKYRARQNVILELGMVLARLGRKRVAILYKESVERPSDIDGLIYIAFEERIEDAKALLFRELENAGYAPNTEAL
jgi:predicted nucleotide-binding protein